jgi:hypothetical protein
MREIQESGDPSATNDGARCCGWGAAWLLPLLLAIVLAAIWFYNGRRIRSSVSDGTGAANSPREDNQIPAQTAAVARSPTVSLILEIGHGRRREWNQIAWWEGMTVGDAMTSAARASDEDEPIKFAQQGTVASAFLTELDGIANEGAGGRNWTYQVNGQRADRSFAVCELRPGDQVLWRFAAPR